MKLLEYLKKTIIEQGESDITPQEIEYGKAIVKSTPFNVSAKASCEAMKSSLENNGIPFAVPGETDKIKLPGVEENKKSKFETSQRYIEWFQNVIKNPDSPQVRGKIFEGLIGGVFGGVVVSHENLTGDTLADKTDVRIPDKRIDMSIKFRIGNKGKNELPMGQIANSIRDEVKKIQKFEKSILANNHDSYTKDEYIKMNQFLRFKTPSFMEMKFGKNANVKPSKLFTVLKDFPEAKNFIYNVIRRNAFPTIDYFMIGTPDTVNRILVKQYKMDDIMSSILKGNFKLTGNALTATNITEEVPSFLLTIEFPQYSKTKRIKYSIDTTGKNWEIDNKFTNSAFVRKNGEVVGYVRRKFADNKMIYNVTSYPEQLSPDLKQEAINKAIFDDLNNKNLIQIKNPNIKLEDIVKQLERLSNIKSRELFTTKSTIGKEGSVENALSKLLAGERESTLNPAIIQNIRKNPDRFFSKFLDIYKDNPQRLQKFIEVINNLKQD